MPLLFLILGVLIGYLARPVAAIREEAMPQAAPPLLDYPALRELVRAEPEPEPELTLLGTFRITAYCPCPKCCGKWSGGPTASWTMPEEGRTVAADWDILPAGTEIYIQDIGWRTVEDTGSGVDGQALDVFCASHTAALEQGVRETEVYTVAQGG